MYSCTCNTLLHYLVKVENPNVTNFDIILNKLLACSCGHFEHLTYHLTVVRQTVSRLLTSSDWLTFWRRRLESTVENCSVEHCCIIVIFSPWLSSHRLRSFYTILRVLYTYLSKIISVIFLWQVTEDLTLNFRFIIIIIIINLSIVVKIW